MIINWILSSPLWTGKNPIPPNSLFLCLFFFSLLLLFIYISMFFCKFHTQSRKKMREGERESFKSLFLNEKLCYKYFLSFIFIFCARTFIFNYISIVILYVFFLIFIFGAHVMFFHFCFCHLYIYIYIYIPFSIFSSFTFYLYQSIPKKDEIKSFYSLFLNEKLYHSYFGYLFIYFSYNSSFQFSNRCFSIKNYTTVFFSLSFFYYFFCKFYIEFRK